MCTPWVARRCSPSTWWRGRARASRSSYSRACSRDAALEVGHAVHAATDVTGFGLLGHLRELLTASGLAGEVDAAAVPVIDGARDLVAAGMVAGGTQRNHAFVSDVVDWGALSEDEQLLLA